MFTFEQTFGAFWRFFLAAALPVAGLIALLTAWAVSLTRQEVAGSPVLWLIIAVLSIAWFTAVSIATWHRLNDAGAHPTFGLVWPFLPVAWVGVFAWWPILAMFGFPAVSDASLRAAFAISTLVTVGLLVFVLILCAQQDALWARNIKFVWIALALNPVLSSIALLVGWIVKKRFFDRNDSVRTATRLLLALGTFSLWMSYVWWTMVPGGRGPEPGSSEQVGFTSTLICIGLLMSAVHIWRWISQARYFPTAYITTKYYSGGGLETDTLDPRWHPARAAVFKIFGFVWIWMTVVGLSFGFPSTVGLLLGGTILYWGMSIGWYWLVGLPFLTFIVMTFAGVYPHPTDTMMRTAFIFSGFLVIWFFVSVAFGNKYNWLPSDRRTNYYHAFMKYLETSPW